jgi:hypothetical protein
MGERRTPNHTAVALGVIVALAGLVTMIVGVYLDLTVVGIIGFAVLFSGVMIAVATPGKKNAALSSPAPSNRQQSAGSFMDRMNERWERRQDGTGA